VTLRLRLRVPLEHKGKLAAVTVGGKPWSSFNAVAETVDFAQSDFATEDQRAATQSIKATFN